MLFPAESMRCPGYRLVEISVEDCYIFAGGDLLISRFLM